MLFPGVTEEVKDYQEQLKQMLKDLVKEKEKDVEKPLPLMNQVHTNYTELTPAVIHVWWLLIKSPLHQKPVSILKISLTCLRNR